MSEAQPRPSDDEIRELFLSPLTSTLETSAAVAMRMEVNRARAAESALRSENERLREALREIDQKTGHFGEAPPPPEWMPMLSLIAWVGRTARAVLAEEEGGRP